MFDHLPYDVLKLNYEGRMPYKIQLTTYEWHLLRNKIILRDKHHCCRCNLLALSPVIHHTFYILNKLAWEYPSYCFVLLCPDCHSDLHKETQIKVFTDYTLNSEVNFTPCKRCFGIGYFPQFDHINNGACFRCDGARFEELINITGDTEISEPKNENDDKERIAFLKDLHSGFYKSDDKEIIANNNISAPADDLPF